MTGTALILALAIAFAATQFVGEAATRCLMYSWLGPDAWAQYNDSVQATVPTGNVSLADAHCKDLDPKPIPCVDPILLTAPVRDGFKPYRPGRYGDGFVDGWKAGTRNRELNVLFPRVNQVATGTRTRKCVIGDDLYPTENVGVPDGLQILEAFGTAVECYPGDADVCVVSAFYFDAKVVNVTAYCTRISVNEDTTMTSGCVTAVQGTYKNTVCACQPSNEPCNTFLPSNSSNPLQSSLLILFLYAWLQLQRSRG